MRWRERVRWPDGVRVAGPDLWHVTLKSDFAVRDKSPRRNRSPREVDVRIALTVIAYLTIALVFAFLGYAAWFAYLWGFNPLWLFPLYLFGLIICGILILFARRSRQDSIARD